MFQVKLPSLTRNERKDIVPMQATKWKTSSAAKSLPPSGQGRPHSCTLIRTVKSNLYEMTLHSTLLPGAAPLVDHTAVLNALRKASQAGVCRLLAKAAHTPEYLY